MYIRAGRKSSAEVGAFLDLPNASKMYLLHLDKHLSFSCGGFTESTSIIAENIDRLLLRCFHTNWRLRNKNIITNHL